MKIEDIIQTVILICCLIMFPVLGLAYAFYSQATISSSEALDKSFGVMTDVFGGAATLAAAYIASKLFNDWRDVHRAQYISSACEKLKNSILNLNSRIFDLEIILDSTDIIRNGFPIALIPDDKKNEILNLIPSIKSLCKQITHDVRHLESDILSLKYISTEAFIKIHPLYTDLSKAVDINYKNVLANRGAYSQFNILSSCKSFTTISCSKLKNLQDATLNEMNKLNSPK